MSASFAPHGTWIPLMEYAMRKGVSLSTLRRYIKADKVQHRSENGRYLIWDESAATPFAEGGLDSAESKNLVEDLEKKLRRAQAEIAELKMLVSLYEEQSAPMNSLHP